MKYIPIVVPVGVLDKLDGISAPGAYSILSVLRNPSVAAVLNGQMVAIKDLVQLDDFSYLPAKKVGPLTFWGGPPARLAWYEGTLYTLLMDRIKDYLCQHTIQELLQLLGMPLSLAHQKIKVWL
jgi:hypothetical protein